ncbi:MAG TPA: DUF4188 domain-containing protein [Bryobacteraceae bacterium]
MKITRQTADLSAYPDLVVIYLGMRVNRLGGIAKLIAMGPKIQASVDAKSDGLLLHEGLIYSLFPLHVGMRQYWRDFQSLETWARSLPHRQWWSDFVLDPGGHRLLARNLFPARRHGSHLRRHPRASGIPAIRAVAARARSDVLRAQSGKGRR